MKEIAEPLLPPNLMFSAVLRYMSSDITGRMSSSSMSEYVLVIVSTIQNTN